ncbi:MAG: DUF5688 family protein [Acetatifactor muris]|nr:DUF5688 family protein [Acetatifactor muris]
MTLKEFATTTQAKVAARLNKETDLKEVLKLNGIKRYGLIIFDSAINVSPTIYLEPFYGKFLETQDWDCVIEDIIKLYRDNMPGEPMDTKIFFDFSQVKEKIFYRLINYAENRELLEQMPHIRFLDLAKVFCIRYEKEEVGSGIISIYHSHLEHWGISADELETVADVNSPLFMAQRISNMSSVLVENGVSQEDLSVPMPEEFSSVYVMSNISKSNGAGTICYPNILKTLSEKADRDIIILPSSIHEVILIPFNENENMETFRDMVHYVNANALEPEDFLSDNVYIYRRNTGQIEIA